MRNSFQVPIYERFKTEFIWGIKASDDMSGRELADLWTTNDIEITYDQESKKYGLSIETIYQFKDGLEGQKIFLTSLLDEFTRWIVNKSIATKFLLPSEKQQRKFDFNGNYYIETDSVEELYIEFLWSVKEFCKQ